MDLLTHSPDGVPLHAEVTGSSPVALLFVHGWLGSSRWWDAARDAFSSRYTVVAMDLAGHGRSGGDRQAWSAETYAGDIEAVAARLDAPSLVLVGHSMSGAYVTLAAPHIPRVKQVVLVDTLRDLEHPTSLAQVKPMFDRYRADYEGSLREMMPRFLFVPETPAAVVERLTNEFLRVSGDRAAELLEPLYRCDLQEAARAVKVPVRAINSDAAPTATEGNRRFFADFDVEVMAGVGHYPMLEKPEVFHEALRRVLLV